jgi:hypothetical protein
MNEADVDDPLYSAIISTSIDDTDMMIDNDNESINLNNRSLSMNISNTTTTSTSQQQQNHHHQQQQTATISTRNPQMMTYNSEFEINSSNIDIDMYVSGYSGLMRINRLVFLAEHCPSVRIDALNLGLSHIMETYNTQYYTTVQKQLADHIARLNGFSGQTESQLVPNPDLNWIEATNKKAALKLEKLDSDLKSAKSLSIKDCIRRGQEDLADHFLDMGDLTNALKCYSRSRDYCSNNKNLISLCLNVIKVSIFLKNWSYVLSYVNKVENAIEPSEVKIISSKTLLSILNFVLQKKRTKKTQ